MELTLEAVRNYDYMSGHNRTVRIKPYTIKVKSLKEASAKTQEFIEENDLGSGNLPEIKVSDKGKVIATISYNGRIWDNNKRGVTI